MGSELAKAEAVKKKNARKIVMKFLIVLYCLIRLTVQRWGFERALEPYLR